MKKSKKGLDKGTTSAHSVSMKRQGTRLYFDPDLLEWLKKEAARRHSSVSQVVRNLVVDEIEKRKKNEKQIDS